MTTFVSAEQMQLFIQNHLPTRRVKAVAWSAKASRGCWTCKRRKIGCDKTLPWCTKCISTGRECLGYGLKLSWPDEGDGRRKDAVFAPAPVTSRTDSSARCTGQFLLTTPEDLMLLQQMEADEEQSLPSSMLAVRSVSRSLATHPRMESQHVHFLSYYSERICTMISTLQADNGFRTELLPMALSGMDPSASALCNAMMAVAAVNHWGPEAALPFKARATRHLVHALSSEHSESAIAVQAAASMMLCVYTVFDESEEHFGVHLNGAKHMLSRLSTGKMSRPSNFLLTWFLYHEVMGVFSNPLRGGDEPDPFTWLDMSDDDKSMVIGSLGCSLEVLEIIHRTNMLRSAVIRGESNETLVGQRQTLETRLQNLAQRLPPAEESATPHRILATAEWYRLSALLYLLRVVPVPGQADDAVRAACVDQSLEVLTTLDLATSPWPLFILACEINTGGSSDDECRICILNTLDRMDNKRNVGNVLVLRELIRTFWTQCDLRSAPPFKWWELLKSGTTMPWFI